MKVALYARFIQQLPLSSLQRLFSLLAFYKMRVQVFSGMQEYVRTHGKNLGAVRVFSGYEDLDTDTEIMISLGGDGTFLDAAHVIRDKAIPIIGINFGRLGFLADANKKEMQEIIAALHRKNYFIEKRTLLHIAHSKVEMAFFSGTPFALNDCTVKSQTPGAMLQIQVFLNGEDLCTYFSDGIIVATPTGSTGYALSCGGPIIFPDTPCLLITAIAPHHLNARPIVVSNERIITLKIHSRETHFVCALDARRYTLPNAITLAVQREKYETHIVKLHERSFLHTLKEKLFWGEERRSFSTNP